MLFCNNTFTVDCKIKLLKSKFAMRGKKFEQLYILNRKQSLWTLKWWKYGGVICILTPTYLSRLDLVVGLINNLLKYVEVSLKYNVILHKICVVSAKSSVLIVIVFVHVRTLSVKIYLMSCVCVYKENKTASAKVRYFLWSRIFCCNASNREIRVGFFIFKKVG